MPSFSTQQRPARPAMTPPRRPPSGAREPGTELGFFVFLLVNAALYVRPSDVLPGMEGVELYRYLILASLAVSFPAVLHNFRSAALEERPIDVCLLLTFPLVVLSGAINVGVEHAFETGVVYLKLLVYYFLLVSLVTTPARLRVFLACLLLFTCVAVILSVLDFYKVIAIPRIESINGKPVTIDPNRMYGPGIFSDPNDICMVIVFCIMVLWGRLADGRGGLFRWLWLGPLAVFLGGFVLTQSRGGLLALLAGAGVLVVLRYGWSRALLIGAIGVPLLLVVLGGRQTAISSDTNTGQERIMLWNEGMVMFRANPVFGVSLDRYQERAGLLAHNSFMQAFAELGFFGGMFLFGAVVLSVGGLYRLGRPVLVQGRWIPRMIVDPEVRQLHPYVTGAIVAYCTGMLTLSLNIRATTFTVFGLATVMLALATTQPPTARDRFNTTLLGRLAALSVVFLIGMFVLIRLTFRP